MDLRKQIGDHNRSPFRNTLHSQAMQQDRDRLANRSRSPYDQASRDDYAARTLGPRGPSADQRHALRQTQEIPGQSYGDSLYKVDERHEELRRQIALKEKLLADMQSERESTRRLRYNKDPHQSSVGTLGTINRDRSPLTGAPPLPAPPFADPARANYPLRGSPYREQRSLDRPSYLGSSPDKRSSMPSTQATRPGVSFNATVGVATRGDPMIPSPEQKQLQFYPPHQSKFAKNYTRQSPLRNRSVSGRKSGSGSRSKSRSLSHNRGFRGSAERPVMNPAHRFPMQGPVVQPRAPENYQQPPIPRIEERQSPLRRGSPPSPYKDNFVMPATEVTLNAAPYQPPPPRPIIGEMVSVGPNVRDKLFVDRIEAMMMDNASLQRRLNGVSDDLEQLRREKEDLISKLRMMEIDNERLGRITNQKDEIDMANQTMQEDLEKARHQNKEMEEKARREQHEATTVGGKLNVTSADKQNLVHESHNIEADLMKTLHKLDDLRRVFDDVLRQLGNSQRQIEELNAEDLSLNHANIDLASQVARVQADRQEMNKRVQELTIIFDETVRDKTFDRRMIDDKRRWQTKILTCKILNQFIQKHQRFQVHQSFRELHEYSGFDQSCHDKLKAFSIVCYKLGCYRQKIALHQWYVNSLKPLAFRHHNVDLSYMIECNQIQARVFYAWRQYLNDKMTRYHRKTNAIDKTWFLLARGVQQEKKRAFQIWKEKKRFGNEKTRQMRHLLKQKNDKARRLAFAAWLSYCSSLDYAVRKHVLHLETTNRLLLSQVFSQLKAQTKIEKQNRLRVLAHCVKGWRDHIRYNRHLMHANMASIQFVQTNRTYTLKACFGELLRHKEAKKFQLLDHAVENDMNPGIKGLEEHNYEKSREILTRSQYRAGVIVRNMLGKRLFSYLNVWRQDTRRFKAVVGDKLRDQLAQLHRERQRAYFYHWKSNSFNKKNQGDHGKNMHSLEVNEQMQNAAMENEKDLRQKEEFIRTTKRRLTEKIVRKLYYRQLGVAIGKWQGICKTREAQESQFLRVAMQMRKRNLREAFTNYQQFFKWSRQHDQNVRGANNLLEKINMRNKAQLFNALVFYTNRNLQARRYWKKILSRLDQFMKLRAVKVWQENAGQATIELLTAAQHQTTTGIQKRQQMLKDLETFSQDQGKQFDDSFVQRRNKAYKQIGNYFMRSYNSKTERALKLWRMHLRDKRHRQEVLLRTVQHWRKSQFAVVKRIFREFVSLDRQNDANNEIKRKQIDQNAIIQTANNGNEQQENFKEEAEIAMQEILEEQNIRDNTTKKLMEIMERRNKEWILVSKKRMIFHCWRHASRQQRAFIHSVVNALEKSMKMKGFHYIKQSHLDMRYHDKVTRLLRKFTNRFTRTNGLDAFNKWKMFSLSKVDEKFTKTMNELKEKDDAFLEHVDQIKSQNNMRCFNFFLEKHKSNVFKSWVNFVKHQKLVRSKEQEFLYRRFIQQRKLAVVIWKQRVETTKFLRSREDVLIEKLNKRKRRAVFKGLKDQFENVSDLTKSIGRLEKFMRSKILYDSFCTIHNFADSRVDTNGIDKEVGSRDLMRMVKQAYYKQLQTAFFRFRNNSETNTQKNNRLKILCGKLSTGRLRKAFYNWRWAHNRAELLDDQYFCGPTRADHWEAEREVENLQDFMRQEQYSENEIANMMKDVDWKTNGLMKKYIIRWRCRYSQKKWLPYIMDRWKQYVRIRKLIRHQFRFCENQVHNVKSDLQRAFNKWKSGPEVLSHELSKLPAETLVDLAVRSTQQVAKCSDQLAENQQISNHLMIQRDEFLNYYIKSQVLAMALVKDRSRFVQMQSWSRWNRVRRRENRDDYHREIRDAAYLQANLEQRQRELEASNDELRNENADLSGFTTDGEIVRNNMNKVKAEVELLKSQIAETDPDYAQLLEEQERLRKELALAEERAKNNKNQKFVKPAGLKASGAGQDQQENIAPEQEKGETESERKQRERFERLQEYAKGASIR